MKIHCLRCGKEFDREEKEFFCSDECRKYKRRACMTCGKEIGRGKYFCSDECRKIMQKTRREERKRRQAEYIAGLKAEIDRLKKSGKGKGYAKEYVAALEKEHDRTEKFFDAIRNKKLRITRDMVQALSEGTSFEAYVKQVKSA